MNTPREEINTTDHGHRNPRSGRRSNKASQVVSLQNPCQNNKTKFNIGTWNVRTMKKAGKLDELAIQMNILGICETRWAGNGDYIKDDLRIIHSGNDKGGQKGVAIVLRGRWKENVLNTYHVNDRILMIKIEAEPTNLYVIQVYFPTSKYKDEVVETVYEQLEELLILTEDKSNVILMGDFNASVGSSLSNQGCVGKFGFGNMNARGERLLEFCEQYEMIITNTMYEVPDRRRYTWKTPGDMNRFQIDFILVKKKYRNQVTSSHSYPGSQIDSDHNLVKAKCNIRFKKRKILRKKKWCLEKLKEEETANMFRVELRKKLVENEENTWGRIKNNMKETGDKVLGKHTFHPRKPWITEEILVMIKQRNEERKRNYDKYKQIKNKITDMCRKAKDLWLRDNCEEIEYCLMKNNPDKAYNKVKSLQYTPRTRSNIVKDKEGTTLFEINKVAERWKEYMEDLYEGEEILNENDYIESEEQVNVDEKGPPITREEFELGIKTLNEKKAAGIDDVPAEVLKCIDESTKEKLFKIISDCYETGEIPSDFVKSKCITIPKKGNANDCSNYRTISLLSHTSKILLNIIKNRLKEKVEQHLGDDQFGFRKERGTREAILALRQILERRLDVNLPTYVTFIDLEKAFDKVDWALLFKTLKERKIDWKDRRLILRLYKFQSTVIDVNGILKEAKIRKGVRQGCPLSPYLFNIFIEASMEIMKETTAGVSINGQKVHSIRFADDIALVAGTVQEMNNMLNVLSNVLDSYKLKINVNKTKTMMVRKEHSNAPPNGNIKLKGIPIQQVEEFCYLGSHISYDNQTRTDVRRRIALAKQAFMKKYNLLTNKHLTTETRKKFIKPSFGV
uniref:Craniofacial development protein 2 n=1 Tax=Cacopsylla melanoneura TaxID=428564 RepID=A0A8D8U352_9HEMI